MGYIEDLKAAQDRLTAATKEHAAAVKSAEQAEKKARREHDSLIAKTEKALKALDAKWDKPIETLGGLKLFADKVTSPTTTLDISEGVEAKVDTSGLLKKHVFLTLTSKSGQIVEEYDSDKEKEAREFGAKVVNQSSVAGAVRTDYESERARLTEEIQRIKDDTSGIDAAAAAAQAARDDTAAVDEAARLLEEVKSSATEEDLVAAKEYEQQARKKKMMIGGTAAAAILVIMLFATHIICFHNWQEATCVEPETCSVCGRTRGEALGHAWSDPTCTKPQTCERCGETSGDSLGHQIDEWKTTKEATCTSEGSREGVCVRCGETQTESIAKKEHEFGEWETVKAATCAEEGESHRVCKQCGLEEKKALELTEHTPGDWKVIEDFKINKDGSVTPGKRARVCTVCGKELETEKYTTDLSTSQKNAMRTAQNYLSFMAFSYSGLVEQLEFEGYSHEDATFAVDHCGADWNEQAAEKAESYLDFMGFSRDGLIEQLEFEGFTYEQAEHGVNAVGL